MVRSRLTKTERRQVIVTAAAKLMREGDLNPSLSDIAEACGVVTSIGTVRHYFPNIAGLRLAAAKSDPVVKSKYDEAGLK